MVVYNYFLVEEWMRDRQRTTNRLCTIISVLFKICWIWLVSTFAVHESIFIIQGYKSHSVLFNARCFLRFQWQGKDYYTHFFWSFTLCVKNANKSTFIMSWSMHYFIRKGKIDSENVLNGTRVYGAACWITLLATFITICTGMRNLNGSQSLLKLLQMIIHLGEANFRIMFVKTLWTGDTWKRFINDGLVSNVKTKMYTFGSKEYVSTLRMLLETWDNMVHV